MSGFFGERTVKSVRKARRCCACGQMIEVGSSAIDWSGLHEGVFEAVSYHVECRAAEIALNRLNETQYDEWIGLADLEWEDWQFILDDHPTVAARLGLTQAKIDVTVAEMAECRRAWAAPPRSPSASPSSAPQEQANDRH